MAEGNGHRPHGWMGIWRAGRRPGLKAIMIALLTFAISIPMLYVSRIIMERSARAMAARQDMAQNWGGGAQAITGPLLVVPFMETVTTTKGGPGGESEQVTEVRKHAVFTPEELTAEGELELKRLRQGIYALYTYEAEIVLGGRFARPDLAGLAPVDARILWEQAYLSVPVSHPNGLRPSPELSWGRGRPGNLRPRALDNGLSETGVHAPVAVTEAAGDGSGGYPFRVSLSLRGSERLTVTPLAARTQLGMSSKPYAGEATGGLKPISFDGTASGSTARWTVEGISLNWPRAWVAEERTRPSPRTLDEAALGVAFKVPSDYYGHVARVTRYAPLFVGLTFVVIFLLESLGRRQFHMVQYFMVGGSLSIFYLLLLALAEQMDFTLSYLIAAGVNVLILSVYGARLAGSARVFVYFLPALAAIYGALYAFLEWEDQALLITSLVMLTGLSISMLLTPKVKWYGEE